MKTSKNEENGVLHLNWAQTENKVRVSSSVSNYKSRAFLTDPCARHSETPGSGPTFSHYP